MGNNKLDFIQKDVKHYFGFLFERGYEIRDLVYDFPKFRKLESAT